MLSALSNRAMLWGLVASMAIVTLSATGLGLVLLYRTAYASVLDDMENAAVTSASLIEAVAQFDAKHSARTHPAGPWGATMSQVAEGLGARTSSRAGEELLIVHEDGGRLHILRRSPERGVIEDVGTISETPGHAEDVRRALAGKSGSGELIDYRGNVVLAGYAPVPTLGIGIVQKIDLSAVRAPYLRAGLWAGIAGLVLAAFGALLLAKLTQPLRTRAAQSERRLRALLAAAPVGVYETDRQGHCLYVNEHWCELAGMTPGQALGDGWVKALHPDDRAAVNSVWNEFVAGRAAFSMNYRLRRPDGAERWVHGEAVPLRSEEGVVTGYTGTLTDITSQKAAQEEAHLAHDRLNEAQRMAMVGSWELDLTTNALVWSDEIYRMFEVDKYRFGASYEAFLNTIHPEDRDRVNQAYTNSLATRQPYEIAHRLRLRDGTIRWVNERCESFFDENGKPVRSIGTVQDITDRILAMQIIEQRERELRELNESLERRVEERTAALATARDDAERANRAKSEFLSRMSHELRTPMNAILGFSQVLEGETLTPEQRDFVGEIHRAGDHLLELINELLDLSRIEAGKLVTVMQPVRVMDVARDAVQITRSLVAQKQIALVNRCQPQAMVMADPMRLKQILVNLLSNAAKYNRHGGRILISCIPREDFLRIAVTDTGPGIPPEKLQSLFRPFERLGAEFSAVDGTGIGLALSRQLTELMGGQMGLDSTPGEGSTFWFDLPCVPGERCIENLPAQVAPSVPGAGRTILYIEDNPANLRVVEAMFRRYPDIRLLSATNGEFGLELAQRYQPDAILVDIHLPGMDGYAVLEALKAGETTSGIPVVALSADAMPIDIEQGMRAGFDQYLTKPVRLADLVVALNDILEKRDSSTSRAERPELRK